MESGDPQAKEAPRWAKAARGERVATGIKEIWSNPAMLQHFSAIGEAMLALRPGETEPITKAEADEAEAAAVKAKTPLAKAVLAKMKADATRREKRDAIRSALDKLNQHGQHLTDPALKDTPKTPDFSDEEFAAMTSLFGHYKRGAEHLQSAEKRFDDKNLVATLHHISRLKGNEDIAGLLSMAGDSADRAMPQIIKTLAYLDPTRFDTVMNAAAASERIINRDKFVLERAQELAEKHGLEYAHILEIISRPNWKNGMLSYVHARIQGTGSLVDQARVAAQARLIVNGFAGILRTRGIGSYQNRSEERDMRFNAIANGFRDLVKTPGVVRAALLQSALAPDAPDEAKNAHKNLSNARGEVKELLADEPKLKLSLDKLRASPDWTDYSTVAGSEKLARGWLDEQYHSRLDGGKDGGFWAGLWSFLGPLLSNAYGREQLQQVASKIRAMPATP